MNVSDILDPCGAVNAALSLAAPIRDDAHHAEMLAFLNECFEHFGSDDAHPASTRAAATPGLITAPRPAGWRFLMEQHGLRQCDLP